jgi:hypothetical protein
MQLGQLPAVLQNVEPPKALVRIEKSWGLRELRENAVANFRVQGSLNFPGRRISGGSKSKFVPMSLWMTARQEGTRDAGELHILAQLWAYESKFYVPCRWVKGEELSVIQTRLEAWAQLGFAGKKVRVPLKDTPGKYR